MKHHPRSGKPHDSPDLRAHLRLVTMHLTVGAEGFCLHEGAPVAALPGVGVQSGPVGTEALSAVFFPAL